MTNHLHTKPDPQQSTSADGEVRDVDVAIVGGGPAGLQAALVLARTRKQVVVLDAPKAPRNGASHGVHNFVGLDGLRPDEIRSRAWQQIERYGTAQRGRSEVRGIARASDSNDLILDTAEASWRARQVILACGYDDRHPAIEGFAECWANTIIPCPFCDGFENRDRLWGIVPSMPRELDVFPAMVRNWTERRLVIAPSGFAVTEEQKDKLAVLGVPLHVGDITSISHTEGKLSSVTLDTGEIVEVETLLCSPPEAPTALVQALVDDLGLELDDNGYVVVDSLQRTNVDRLWAAGDVQGWMGAIESANAGGMAAAMIVHDWYDETLEAA